MKFSIRHKITLAYALLFFIILAGLGVWLSTSFSQRYNQTVENNLINEARLLAELADTTDNQALTDFADIIQDRLDVRVTVINQQGVPLVETDHSVEDLENHISRPEIQVALDGKTGVQRRYSATLGVDMLYVAVAMQHSGEIVGVLRLSRSLNDIQQGTISARNQIIAVTLVSLLLTALLGWLLSNIITRPLAVLSNKARTLAQGQIVLDHNKTSKDELDNLGQVFEAMAANIIRSMAQQERERQGVEQILHQLPVGVLVVSGQGNLVLANDAAQNILGVVDAEPGKPLTHLTRNWQVNQFVSSLQRESSSDVHEFMLETDDERKHIRMQGAALNSQGRNEIVVVLQDITDVRLLEQQRRDLVANVSHEVRTPLTAINGFAETLLDEGVDRDTAQHFISIIREESQRLSRMLNDLLSLSNLESKVQLKEGSSVLIDVVSDVSGIMTTLAQAKGKRLKVDIPEDITVAVDGDYMEQILMNYIDNAIKYTPQGTEIRVSAEVQDNGFVRIVVQDDGTGIPQPQQKRLFERFFRLDQSRSGQDGTGLGLAIVKHIVEGFGGQVGVVSNPDSGTSFWATLPLKTSRL